MGVRDTATVHEHTTRRWCICMCMYTYNTILFITCWFSVGNEGMTPYKPSFVPNSLVYSLLSTSKTMCEHAFANARRISLHRLEAATSVVPADPCGDRLHHRRLHGSVKGALFPLFPGASLFVEGAMDLGFCFAATHHLAAVGFCMRSS